MWWTYRCRYRRGGSQRYLLGGERPADGPQAPSLERLHGHRRLVEDGRALVDREPGHEAEQEHVPLVRGQLLAQIPDPLGPEGLLDGQLDVLGRSQPER